MSLKLKVGLSVIDSYKRLAYTPWHAIAEFVDNSTQSYLNHKAELDEIFNNEGSQLTVSIVYERVTEEHPNGFLRVSDNAMGMSLSELEHAMEVAKPPQNTSGRSKYGMGLKTASCWIGNHWTVRTKKFGEEIEHSFSVDVSRVAAGDNLLDYNARDGRDKSLHYTIIEITQHNRKFQGRTLGKIRNFLSSMYRLDIQDDTLRLDWQGEKLKWEGFEGQMLVAKNGVKYHKSFEFDVEGRKIFGSVGILGGGHASRAKAGFSILHCGRVVKGWPDSWRPESIYGYQGRNDLVNQRLVGEINLDGFDVSHTKDDILWLGDQEELVETKLKEQIQDYIDVAKTPLKQLKDERRPSDADVDTALDTLREELISAEMVDRVEIEVLPEEAVIAEAIRMVSEPIKNREPTFNAKVGTLDLVVYVVNDMSPNDPYVIIEAPTDAAVVVIINMLHPHISQVEGGAGVLNYFRHCVYDAIAEWQAKKRISSINPNTIKILKDSLLRVPFLIEEKMD